MNFIGVVGARKFNDRKAVEDLVAGLPKESIIVTSGCKGVCTWAKAKAEEKNLEVLVYTPDLSNIRCRFEIPKRYYQRNRELIERCNFVHALDITVNRACPHRDPRLIFQSTIFTFHVI